MNLDGRTKADYIKGHITMEDVIERYHKVGKHRWRTSCPFHGGVNDNLSYTNKVYHCFVCGAGGDVIDFTMRMTGARFHEAVAQLNSDFRLGLDCGDKSDWDSLRQAVLQREAERQRKETAKAVAMTVQRMYGRIQYWVLHRPVQTEMHTRCVDSLDRVVDDLVSGKGWSGDPKAFARSWINCVRAAEKEAAHAG